MAGALLERVEARLARSRRPQNLSLDEYASWFSFGGVQYPFIQQTMSQVDREQIAWTADHAARTSGPVFSLVLARMQAFSQVRFQWTRMKGAQPGDLFGTKELAPLEQPMPGLGTVHILSRMEWDASAAGQAYVRRRGDNLFRLRPDWCYLVLGSNENAENPAMAGDTVRLGVMYAPPGGRPIFLNPQQCAHYAPLPDPDACFLGQSWITPVLRELQGDQASTEHKYKFFENAATPNMVVKFDPSVGVQAVKDFIEILEEDHEGIRNAFKTLYLGGGADAKTVGLTFAQMDYAAIQGRAESRLASAAGVPPSWVGFAEGLQGSALNAGNFNSSRRRLSDGTMVHLWMTAAAALQPLFTPPDSGATLWYDARVPFMRADSSDLAAVQSMEAATIAALIRDGFTPESAVEAVKNNDWGLLEHSGLTSVQLQPPGAGEPLPGFTGTPDTAAAALYRAAAALNRIGAGR